MQARDPTSLLSISHASLLHTHSASTHPNIHQYSCTTGVRQQQARAAAAGVELVPHLPQRETRSIERGGLQHKQLAFKTWHHERRHEALQVVPWHVRMGA